MMTTAANNAIAADKMTEKASVYVSYGHGGINGNGHDDNGINGLSVGNKNLSSVSVSEQDSRMFSSYSQHSVGSGSESEIIDDANSNYDEKARRKKSSSTAVDKENQMTKHENTRRKDPQLSSFAVNSDHSNNTSASNIPSLLLHNEIMEDDYDVDDFMDSRVEMHAVSHNLTSVLMNPRETLLENIMDEFAFEQCVPLEYNSTHSTVAGSMDDFLGDCEQYFRNKYRTAYQFRKSRRFRQNIRDVMQHKISVEEVVSNCFRTVPEFYFNPNFNIHNSEVLNQALIEDTTPKESNKRHEELSNHLDNVEVALLKQIMSRSDAFFRALHDINNLKVLIAKTATRVDTLRRDLRKMDHNITTGPMRIPELERRKRNMKGLHDKMAWMQKVLDYQYTIQQLLSHDDYANSIKLVSEAKAIYQQELEGITCMRQIGHELEVQDERIAEIMCEKFVGLAINWTEDDFMEESDVSMVGRENQHPIGNLVKSLMAANKLNPALELYNKKLFESISLVVRTCLLEYTNPNQALLEGDGGGSAGEGGGSFSSKVKGMTNDNFLACLSMCLESLLHSVNKCNAVRKYIVSVYDDDDAGRIETIDDIIGEEKKVDRKQATPNPEKEDFIRKVNSCLDTLCQTAQKSMNQLLVIRQDSNMTLAIHQIKFVWEIFFHFISAIDNLQCQISTSLLKSALITMSKKFVEYYHDNVKGKLASTLDAEKWVQCDVSPERQAAINTLTSGRSFLPNNKGAASNSLSPTQPVAPVGSVPIGQLTPAIVDGVEFKVVWSVLLVVENVLSYLDIAIHFGPVTGEILSRTVELLKLFDSRTRNLVLGAGAQKTAGLRTINGKTLGLTTQSISFLMKVLPHVRAALLALLPQNHHDRLIELDRISQDLADHHHQLLGKFVSIVNDAVENAAKKLELDWDRFNGKSVFFKDVIATLQSLHKVLIAHLPLDHVQEVFSRIFTSMNRKIPTYFETITPSTKYGREKILDEIEFFINSLTTDLRDINTQTLANLEENFKRKYGSGQTSSSKSMNS